MIESVSNATVPATELGTKVAASKTLCHTPFGDVMVDELSTTDLSGMFGAKPPAVPASGTPAPTPTLTPPTAGAGAGAAVVGTVNGTQPDPHSIPTAQSVFGEHVWLDSPSGAGPNNSHWSYNPIYFATPETAQRIAAMVGGTVVEANSLAPNGPMKQLVPNQMIQLPDGHLVNAGLIADFYNHGYPQYYVDFLVKSEIRGA